MALINSYATLQTAISDHLARSDLSTFLPNFTQTAEDVIYKRLRIRAMETALSGTVASGVLDVPDDYVELKYAYVSAAPVTWLQWVTPEQLYNEYPVRSGSHTPRLISREVDSFIFGPYPSDVDIAGVYYKRLPALSGSNTTNWFTTNAPSVLLYGSLCAAEPFIKNDARLPMWQVMFEQCLKTIEDEEQRERRSGSVPQVRVM